MSFSIPELELTPTELDKIHVAITYGGAHSYDPVDTDSPIGYYRSVLGLDCNDDAFINAVLNDPVLQGTYTTSYIPVYRTNRRNVFRRKYRKCDYRK